ncbi:MAG: tyrosine-type recombinase/integrase [Rhodobacteraceae bacterium]|nr:tyrosine-type recombinase/integrase [Paracoccaceae bacterium]
MGLLSKLLNQSAEGLISNAIIKKQSVTLSEFFDTHYYPHAESTRKKPKVVLQTFDKHMREFLGKFRFPEIDNALLDSWVRDQVKKKYQTSTINKHIFLVNRLLNLARRWNYIDQNTFENLQIKRLPLGDFKQRFLGVDEIAAVLKSAERDQHPFMYFILKLLILTGARSGEARLARWRDIDLQTRIWTVPVSKNGRARRIVLSGAAVELLQSMRPRNELFNISTKQDDYVFQNPRFRKPYNCFFSSWERIRQDAGLPKVRIHDLRHTYASMLINKGASLYEVQKLLGHFHISMTERYAHLLPNTLAERVEIVAGLVD